MTMGPWWEIYQKKQAAMRAQTGETPSPEVATAVISQTMEDTLSEYLREERLIPVREAATATVAEARELLGVLRATGRGDVPVQAKPDKKRFFGLDPMILPLIPSAILLGYLFLNGQLWPALLCAVSVIFWLLSHLQGKSETRTAPEGLSGALLWRAVDGMMLETDRALERARMLHQRGAASQLPEMDGEILEAVQMLSEAQQAGDGAYALKALPGLFAGLLRKNVRLQSYDPEHAAAFDLFPGMRGGRTIRPAVYLEDKLILRGQATQVISGAGEVRHG